MKRPVYCIFQANIHSYNCKDGLY